MIELQLNRDQASILCDALTEWSLCQRDNASYWKDGNRFKQMCLDEALLAESLRDTVRAKMDGEVA